MSATYSVVDTITQIANPFEGSIFILTPCEAAEGIVKVQFANVVPTMFFSAEVVDHLGKVVYAMNEDKNGNL